MNMCASLRLHDGLEWRQPHEKSSGTKFCERVWRTLTVSKIKKQASVSWYILSNMADFVVSSVRSGITPILSEQQNAAFHQHQTFRSETHHSTVHVPQNILYDAKFCVDSKSDGRNTATFRNLKLRLKQRCTFRINFKVYVAVQQSYENQYWLQILNV